MDKIEVRLDRDQLDLLIFALGYAQKHSETNHFRGALGNLKVWLRSRRERRWGDDYNGSVSEHLSVPVGR